MSQFKMMDCRVKPGNDGGEAIVSKVGMNRQSRVPNELCGRL
jgi:hypothetical protein